MRLSLVLYKWPRSRPNGYIWSGKHQMVRKVREGHLAGMQKQIEMVITLILNISALHSCVSRRRTMHTSVSILSFRLRRKESPAK